ncbi:hypothetical protein BD779DRAFT_136442 [Infundibulicybe gibba]|nr:hypothetical protein BD779DRAFT_136442 [Infundibulicybe gibba]
MPGPASTMVTSETLAAAQEACRTVRRGRFLMTALYAILVYEWTLLFGQEYILIHRKRRWSSARVAFLVCRYYPLIVWPVLLWAFVQEHNWDICSRVVRPLYLFLIPFQLSSQAVVILRAWAFTGRKRITLVLLCAAYALLLAAEIWVFADFRGSARAHPSSIHPILTNADGSDSLHAIIGNIGCVRGLADDNRVFAVRTGVLFIASCIVDCLCLLIIAIHCMRLGKFQGPLAQYFLAQGFGAFLVLGLIHITAAVLAFSGTARWAGAIAIPVPLMLSNIVACRLILGLRRRASQDPTGMADDPLERNQDVWGTIQGEVTALPPMEFSTPHPRGAQLRFCH